MATTDTQQTAQFAAQAAVSAAEAKQYLLSIEQPVIDISESVADAQNAAAAAEMARDQAQGISTSLVQTIDSQLSEQETQFESQMTTQQSSFESSQSERESSFEEKSNEFESRFSSQLSAQESTFSESESDKENRFQQFLLNSGYIFLGNYVDGPFQLSARNQYIRYNNQYYRLNAATDVGFTTTGTDATSFANDVTHFVLMDGDTLRQNLASNDGLKWIGKCKDLSTLRTIEPTISGQSIILERAVVGGPLLNVILTHNPDAADAVDDGYSRFVTAGGAVWDADISFGHNVFLAGYSDELNNLAQCVNLIISHKVAKVISRGFVAGGVGAKLVVPANPRADGVTTFTMTAAIKVPSFLALYFDAQGAVLDYSAFNTETALVVSNEFPGLTQDMMFKNNGPGWGSGTGANAGHNEGGIFANGALLKGGNTLSNLNFTTYPGLRVGNVTYPSGSYAHCSGARVFDLRVSGFAEGLRLGSVDTYIPWIRGCHFTFNNIGVATKTAMSGSTAQWANSGERMLLESCLIADNFSHALSRDDRGNFITLKDCNIDYNGGDVVFCGPENIGKTIISGGHVEGNAGGWINCPARTTTAGENNLKMTGGVQLYVNAGVNDAYGGVRPMAFATTIRTVLDMDDFEIFCRAPYVNSAYPAWKPYNPANLARVRMNYPNSGQTYRFLPSYDGAYGYRINNTLLFSGTENENVPTSRTGDFWCIKSGGASCVYGGAGDADSDGVIPIKITLNSPTDTVQLLFSRQITPERGTQHIHGFCSIKAAAFAGALNVSAIARTVASVTRTANTTTGVITETENLYGVNQSISQDILTSLANPTISITKDDYMGTRPLPVQLIGGNYSYLGFLYTGGTGTFYVKLPVWANLDLHPTIGYQ
ncbi:TPA: hypothetical protein MYL55_001351 [Klebsiella variicola subsp. variicola]|uniref:hypothetical protein n=1 Tax=Klebsiella variicola TaxID=244366 RepID=UPI0019554828|nr:hypothetical protein [Klebsiella variicola]HCB0530429.1 hypothetical protein [Klebsiella variicola subsp. variicola]